MNKIKNLFKASPIAMIVAGLVIAGVASAALLTIYGHTTGTADVKQSVLFGDGGTTQTYDVGNSDPVAGNVYYSLTTLENNASDKSAKVQLNTLYSRPGWVTPHTPEDGITTSYKEWAAPEEILTGERPSAIYNSTGDKKYEVWYKTSDANIHYAYYHNASGSWKWDGANTDVSAGYDCPSVTKENGKYYMVNYGSSDEKNFYIYTSDDGKAWTQKGIIYTETRSDLEKVDNPKILKDENGYKMYFQGKLVASPNKYYIFLATSDANNLKEIAAGTTFAAANSGNSVLQPGVAGEWDSLRVMQPTVFKSGNKDYTMLYTGYDENDQKGKIGYAISDDGIAWTKVKVSEQGYDTNLGTNAFKTSVVKTNDNLVLFYQNSNGNKINWTWLVDVLVSGQMIIQPKEVKPFFIENDFMINLAPMNYTIQTNVNPIQ